MTYEEEVEIIRQKNIEIRRKNAERRKAAEDEWFEKIRCPGALLSGMPDFHYLDEPEIPMPKAVYHNDQDKKVQTDNKNMYKDIQDYRSKITTAVSTIVDSKTISQEEKDKLIKILTA